MKCITCNNIKATFNYIDKIPLYCKKCKDENMVDVINKKCIKCNLHQPVYNIEGEPPLYCKNCKDDNMIDVKNKKCVKCNLHQPIYNLEGRAPLYCNGCKDINMVDVKNKKCIICHIKQCRFNYPTKKKGLYCGDCHLDGMYDIFAKKCIICKLYEPNFNLLNEKKPTHCSICKTDNMIDIKHKKCIVCNKHQPSFNYSYDNKPTHCKTCALDNMINIRHKNDMCIVCNIKRPSFNYSYKKKAEYCANCKLKNMCDLVSNKCQNNNCDICVNNIKYDGYCAFCFVHLFHDDERTIKIKNKSKEIQVMCYITNIYKDFVYNKPLYIEGGCCETKRRIDLRILINNTMLCIEIDENQHKYYIKVDDDNRYNDLFMDFSGKYIFIRYNPDKFKDINRKNKNPYFDTRMKQLVDEIEKQKKKIENDENTDLLEIVHLFYDEC
jgi:hypothetical protein